MQLDITTLCRYRLERAREDSAIQLNHAKEFFETVESYIKRRADLKNI